MIAFLLVHLQQPQLPSHDAELFLRSTMDRYSLLGNVQVESSLEISAENALVGIFTKRYQVRLPDRFRITGMAQEEEGTVSVVSVSDGSLMITSFQVGGGPPSVKEHFAPKEVSEASGGILNEPFLGASPFIRFLGGSAKMNSLRKAGSSKLGIWEAVVGANEPTRWVSFDSPKHFGKVQVLLGSQTFSIYRLRWATRLTIMGIPTMSNGSEVVGEFVEEIISQSSPKSFEDSVFALDPLRKLLKEEADDHEEAPGTKLVGSRAPSFGLVGLDGRRLRSEELMGRPALIDFWATWCPPCVEGLPTTAMIANRLRGKLWVLAVSDESVEKIQSFRAKNPIDVPTYRDPSGTANKLFRVDSVPTLVLLDKGGVIADYIVGTPSASRIRQALRKVGLDL